MSQRVVLVIILSILILLPASQPVTAQQQDVVSVTNGIFEVFVQAANGDIGSYTIRTGDNHPATIAEGDNLEVFYGYTHPGSSFNTIRSYSTQTDYVMDQWPTSG